MAIRVVVAFAALASNGPVTVSIDAMSGLMQHYSYGVVSGPAWPTRPAARCCSQRIQ